MKLFAFLNINDPIVAWEVAIGRIFSNNSITYQNLGISFFFRNRLKQLSISGPNQHIINEFNIERHRQKYYPSNVSRLEGVYFFETEAMAHLAIDRWNFPPQMHEFISEVTFSGDRYSYYDSEWITHLMNSNDQDWYENYLAGKTYGDKPLTEIITEGFGIILNDKLRQKAILKVIDLFPTSSLLLAVGMAAAYKLNIWDASLSKSFMYIEDNEIIIDYFIKMDTFEKNQIEIGEALVECYKEKIIPFPIILCNDLASFSLLDLRKEKFSLKIPEVNELFSIIHNYALFPNDSNFS